MSFKIPAFELPVLTLAFLFILLSGCSGGGGSSQSQHSGSPSGPPIETINTSAEIGGPYDMPYEINAATDGNLYIATPFALLQVGKNTGAVKTLISSTKDFTTGKLITSDPSYLSLIGSYLYAGDDFGKIFRVFTGADNYDSIELLYNGHLPGMLNADQLAGVNSTRLFYMGDDGLYAMVYGDYRHPQFVTPYPAGAPSRIIVTENEVFFGMQDDYAVSSIHRFDLNSRTMTDIKTDIQAYAARMTWNAPYLYWVEGTSIYRFNTETSAIQQMAVNVADNIQGLVADDDTIYAYEYYGSPPKVVRVDIQSGTVSVIGNYLNIQNMTIDNGTVYFLTEGTPSVVYKIDGNNPPQQFLIGSDVNLLNIWGLSSASGMLFLTFYDRILVYDLSTGTTKGLFAIDALHDTFFYHNQSLYVYSWPGSGSLTRIPLDKPLRPIEIVSPPPAGSSGVGSLVRDDTYFYWIWMQNSSYFIISRIPIDGSGAREDLFQVSSELRDANIHNGRLYFSCLDECSYPGWVLASIPLSGGVVRPEYLLAGDPWIFHLNGIFYDADTLDFSERTLFAINIEENTDVELLSGLYYDEDSTDVFLQASSKWLYIGQYRSYGIPESKISRYSLIDWKHLGPEEKIIYELALEGQALIPWSISTDGTYLYFWDGAIKKVAE
jgi:hypothetical protein